MATLHRTTASMSFLNDWNGNPCPTELIQVDGVRPAVDPDRHGSGEFAT